MRDTGVYYVIKHEDTSAGFRTNIINFYWNHNFILLDSSKVFYFNSKPLFTDCGTGINVTKPIKLYLTPDSLRELRSEDMQQFLQATIPDSMMNNQRTRVSISSPSDTIRNRAFKIITDHLAAKKISSEYVYIRNWTFEEQAVVTAKTQHLGYDPDTLGNRGDYFAAKQIRQRK